MGVFSADPLAIPTYLVTSHWPFNDTTCQFQGYLAGTLCFASDHRLVLMAVNSYYRTKYHHYFTKKKIVIMMLMTWFYSISAPLIYVLLGNKMGFHPSKFFCLFQSKTVYFWPKAYVAYTFLATISSALNPLIYGVFNKSFRLEILPISSCC